MSYIETTFLWVWLIPSWNICLMWSCSNPQVENWVLQFSSFYQTWLPQALDVDLSFQRFSWSRELFIPLLSSSCTIHSLEILLLWLWITRIALLSYSKFLLMFQISRHKEWESLIDSIRILCALVLSLLYSAKTWVCPLAGIVIFPLICYRSSFSLRIRSILFFHARNLLLTTNLLLSLQKDIDVYVEGVIYLLDRFLRCNGFASSLKTWWLAFLGSWCSSSCLISGLSWWWNLLNDL